MTSPRRRRIVYVWDADYPWDVRTEKTCLALTQAGHDVHIVARNRAWKSTTEQLPEGIVHRLPPWRMLGRRLDDALGFPAFFNPRWRARLDRTVRDVRADLIIARDLPLCPTAIHVGRRHGIPVVLDMAENYPAMMRDIWTSGRQRMLDHLVRNPRTVEAVERYCIDRVQHILTVVEESSERLVQLGVDPRRITVVSNTPPLSRLDEWDAPRETAPKRVEVIYLGLLEVPRGLYDVIDAIGALEQRRPGQFVLRVIGDGRDATLFHERAQALGLTRHQVEFLGRLPYGEAVTLLRRADIGIIPHHANESWNTTIPNKLFDYMAAGLPVLSSDAIPCARVVRETGAGRIFTSKDSASLAAALVELYDSETRHTLSTAGKSAILQRYHWEHDAMTLLGVVNRV